MLLLEVGDLGDALLVRVHVLLAALVDGAGGVAEDDGLCAVGEEEACDGLTRSACAVDDNLRGLQVAVEVLVCVEQGRDNDNRRAVLVVVEDGDVERLLQLVLDVKALRRLDVLEIDAAVGRRDELADLDDILDFRAVHADGNGVDAGEALEENGFALHDRKSCARADVAETEDGGAVRDDGDHIALRCVVVDGLGLLLDCKARRRDTRRVGAAEVVARAEGHGRDGC